VQLQRCGKHTFEFVLTGTAANRLQYVVVGVHFGQDNGGPAGQEDETEEASLLPAAAKRTKFAEEVRTGARLTP
jgi:hypothetical protein